MRPFRREKEYANIVGFGTVYLVKFSLAALFLVNGIFAESLPTRQGSPLRILTINVWSGLDYRGAWRVGEYESAERREIRFQLLIMQIRKLNPDVIVLQEANPVARFAGRLADSLSYDEIHQVCNAGIRIGGIGIPSNLAEGVAILSRRSLNLRRADVWKLSGSPGLYGDVFSFHLDESIFALVGKVTVDRTPVIIVGVHLVAAPPVDSALQVEFMDLCSKEGIATAEYNSVLDKWREGAARQKNEVARLLTHLKEFPGDTPVVVAGDFNATPDSPPIGDFLREGKFWDTFAGDSARDVMTWDVRTNKNIVYSTNFIDARGDSLSPYERLCALYDNRPRKIDYIFLSNQFIERDVVRAEVTMDSLSNGLYGSDHFGIAVDLDLGRVATTVRQESPTVTSSTESTFEPLPIASYDTDVGLGYGAKAFLLNKFGGNESFDCVAFNSTKGERWYRLVFSLPDFELRQGKIYPLAFDLIVDYDKWIKNSFFGIGNRSQFSSREYYSREPLDVSITLSRGFSPHFVSQGGVRYRSVRNFNFSDTSVLAELPPLANSATASYQSVFFNVRYDTRNSFVNPSLGDVAECDVEEAFHTSFNNSQFTKVSFALQHYFILFFPTTVLAIRAMGQGVMGDNLPVQLLSSVGGNSTVRGSPQDRFLDNISAVVNSELRFPLAWRFGGVVGVDAGKVWSSLAKIDVSRWAANPTAGLRLYMETFVVRFDVGFGHETTGVYFNFGQIF